MRAPPSRGGSRATADVAPQHRVWFPTTHAVERFRERVRPDLDDAAAREVLATVATEAVCVGEAEGKTLWRVPARPMEAEYVVHGRRLITVLDPQTQPLTRERTVRVVPPEAARSPRRRSH